MEGSGIRPDTAFSHSKSMFTPMIGRIHTPLTIDDFALGILIDTFMRDLLLNRHGLAKSKHICARASTRRVHSACTDVFGIR